RSSPFAFFKLGGDRMGQGQKKTPSKPAVGIVYVEGAITLGGGPASLFAEAGATSSRIRKALDQAARDDSIKAVVLRVNSPGGSAVAGEIILAAPRRGKGRKALGASTGDVAGSGGNPCARASAGRSGARGCEQRRSERRGRGQAGDGRHVEEGRRHVQVLQARPERRAAGVRRPVHARRTRADAGLDGRRLQGLPGARPGDPGRPAQEAAG